MKNLLGIKRSLWWFIPKFEVLFEALVWFEVLVSASRRWSSPAFEVLGWHDNITRETKQYLTHNPGK